MYIVVTVDLRPINVLMVNNVLKWIHKFQLKSGISTISLILTISSMHSWRSIILFSTPISVLSEENFHPLSTPMCPPSSLSVCLYFSSISLDILSWLACLKLTCMSWNIKPDRRKIEKERSRKRKKNLKLPLLSKLPMFSVSSWLWLKLSSSLWHTPIWAKIIEIYKVYSISYSAGFHLQYWFF